MEGLDPEDARRVIDPALKLMIDAVHRTRNVVQSTGDGISRCSGRLSPVRIIRSVALYGGPEDAGRTSGAMRRGCASRQRAN